jgi:predicted phosphodiesterase
MKRVLVISDLHCGHRAGLTPPSWQYKENDLDYERSKFGEIQKSIWDFYSSEIEKLQPIDSLFVMGDCIDGKGEKSGGTELIEVDRLKQTDIATECINFVKAKHIVIIRGTPYHVGKEEDFENVIAKNVNATKIGDHEWIDINGLVFDLKHFVSSSVIPHGRHTAISRDKLWNLLWAERNGQPKSDILIRGHVHYFGYSGNSRSLNINMPALQGWGSKFGTKIPSGIVDIGLLYFDIESRDEWSWYPIILESELLTVETLKLE